MVARFKKIHALLVLLIVFSLVQPSLVSAEQGGSDDLKGHWAETAMRKWIDKGLLTGYPDGSYKPDRHVSRSEFIALANRYYKLEKKEMPISFGDVVTTDWFYEDVAVAASTGYITGYPDQLFKPLQNVTREEAAVMVAKLAKPTLTADLEVPSFMDGGQIASWSKDAIHLVASNGIMKGYPDNTFKPERQMTRAEVVTAFDNLSLTAEADSTAGIQGTVFHAGAPVKGAVVKLYEKNGKSPIASVKSDEFGTYRIESVSGVYDITAESDSLLAYQSGVIVAELEFIYIVAGKSSN